MEIKNDTILIIEDDAGLSELLSDIVEGCGYQSSCVHLAKDAIDWLQMYVPFLMILDYSLPDMNAKELIGELGEKVQSLAPFIVSTGQGDERVAVDMMKLGAKDYIVKDSNFIELMPLVISRIGKEIENENKIKQAEKKLVELNKFSNQIVSAVHNGIVVVDQDLQCKIWNPYMEYISGLPASKVIGQNPVDIFPFLAELGMIDNVKKSLQGEVSPTIDYQFSIQSTGKSGWVSCTIVPLLNASGEIIGVIASINNITERKQAEELLRASEALYRSILNASPDMIILADIDGRIKMVSDSVLAFYGSDKKDELMHKNIFQLLISEDVERALSNINKRFDMSLKGVVEYSVARANGESVFAEVNTDVIRNVDGVPESMVLVIRDITERKISEQALKESEQYTNSILAAIPDLIFVLDSDGVFIDLKTGNTKDLALPIDSFINKNLSEVFPDSIASLVKNAIDDVFNNQLPVSIEYQIPVNHEMGDFECVVVPFVQNRVIAMVRNITRRKQVENSLKNSQEELKHFAAHLQSVREEERVLLAREIHDELGQILVALKIDLGIFKQKVFKSINKEDFSEISNKFEQLFDLVDNTLKTTRKIMTGLRPDVLELVGLSEAAKLYTKEFAERYQINCQFKTRDADFILDS